MDDFEKAAEERRAYMRLWRAKNKERVKVYNRNYWLRKINKRQNNQGEDISLPTEKGVSDDDKQN